MYVIAQEPNNETTSMRGLRPRTLVASTGPWICRRCPPGRRKADVQNVSYGTTARELRVTKSVIGSTRLAVAAAAVTGLGAGSFFLTPDGIKGGVGYTYAATVRTGRVLSTLTTCIDE